MLHELVPDTKQLAILTTPVLRPYRRHPAPTLDLVQVSGAEEAAHVLPDQLSHHGLGLVRFKQPLGDVEFQQLGGKFGVPLVENAPEVQPFVVDKVVLHLRQQQVISGKVEHAPFEPRELALHTESSRRPADQQPRFIMLYCVTPGDDTGSQTVLVPFSAVHERLSGTTIDALRQTRVGKVDHAPPVLRDNEGRDVFSFRDMENEAYLWESEQPRERLQAALGDLLTACYTAESVFGSHWHERDLIMIDNHWWFHGRTWSPDFAACRQGRHLTRLRVLGPNS